MKVGDRVNKVTKKKYQANGTIIKLTKDYTVISWDDINGEWHYTKDQLKNIEIINENR